MLRRMEGIPQEIIGVVAQSHVTKVDYEQVLEPLFEEAQRKGRPIRFLYQFGPEFQGFTAGAAFEDFKVGIKYLSLLEKCAVVSDVDWLRWATQTMGVFIPCPVKTFKNAEINLAIKWLES